MVHLIAFMCSINRAFICTGEIQRFMWLILLWYLLNFSQWSRTEAAIFPRYASIFFLQVVIFNLKNVTESDLRSLQKKERKKEKLFSCVRLFATPWTVAYQALLSVGFSRQECWSGLPFPSPEDIPDPELNLGLPYCRQMLYHLSHQGSHEKSPNITLNSIPNLRAHFWLNLVHRTKHS